MAWRQLLEVYGPLLRRWLTRTGVPAADHEDVCQEVSIVVVTRVHAGQLHSFAEEIA